MMKQFPLQSPMSMGSTLPGYVPTPYPKTDPNVTVLGYGTE